MTQLDRYVIAAMFAASSGFALIACVGVAEVKQRTANVEKRLDETERRRDEAIERYGNWISRFERFDRRLATIETTLKWPRFAKHCSQCEQCGGEDVDKTLCEEGFELLQADMKAGAK